MGTLSRPIVRLGGVFNPLIREFGEMLYQFEQPFIVDGSRFERAFALSATPYRDGIRETLDWVRRADQPQLATA